MSLKEGGPANPPAAPSGTLVAIDRTRSQRAAGGIGSAVKSAIPPLLLVGLMFFAWWWYVETTGVRATTLPSPGRVVREG